ncbi:uncharacterized protein RJT20DRAFT_5692 [Scheffersomyces xylosifermentans]|uniref:uncharacterized protein n=1 Tax=Scheffersomyces xylosifermentans TaxID=1304137 RepID=UPI00315D47BC
MMLHFSNYPYGGWSAIGGSAALAKRSDEDEILELDNGQHDFYFCPNEQSPIQLTAIASDCVIGELYIFKEAIVTGSLSPSRSASSENSGSLSITTVITSSEVITITECPSTVTDCPAASIRTVTIPVTVTTTYCPESTSIVSTITSTYTSLETQIITSCPSKKCTPGYQITTTIEHVLTTTYYPIVSTSTTPPVATTPVTVAEQTTRIVVNGETGNGAGLGVPGKTTTFGNTEGENLAKPNTVAGSAGEGAAVTTTKLETGSYQVGLNTPVTKSLKGTVAAESLAAVPLTSTAGQPVVSPSVSSISLPSEAVAISTVVGSGTQRSFSNAVPLLIAALALFL